MCALGTGVRPCALPISRVRKIGVYYLMTVPDPGHPVHRKKARLQQLLKFPGIATLLAVTRWKEGAACLRISRNRPPLAQWRCMLETLGFSDVSVRRSDLPLAIVMGRTSQ